MRVYELARELGVKNDEALAKCKDLGLRQTNRLAGLSDEEADRLRKAFAGKGSGVKKVAPPKTKRPRKAVADKTPVDKAEADKAPVRGHKARKKGAAKKTASDEPAESARKGRATATHRRERVASPTVEPDDVPATPQASLSRYIPPSLTPRYPRRPSRRMKGRRPRRPVSTGPKRTKFTIQAPISIKDFSATIGIKANAIILKLMQQGAMVSINAVLDEEQIIQLGADLGLELDVREEVTAETIVANLDVSEDKPENLVLRAPVVTFLGHVDHGKTSLLDRIRKSHVAEHEHGGITQHTAAYRITVGGHTVTFLDTPGHEAFTAMRARGANVTDVVTLVVAADDGVMPQTEEAIDHARAAGVAIVVAINKCDKPEANPMRVKQQLANLGLQAEEWGGDTVCVEVSATTGQGIDDLIEMLALVAEMAELKADPAKLARGTVLEANMSDSRGPTATVLVSEGTLRVGEVILCGSGYGRVKGLFDDQNRRIKEAGPSWPAIVIGLDQIPEAGDSLVALKDLHTARSVAEERRHKMREARVSRRTHVNLENLFASIEQGEVQELCLLLKADVGGTLEALSQVVGRISTPEVKTRILRASVGGISTSDVLLADASDAIIVGLNVTANSAARTLAEEKGVTIRVYNVIYRVKDEIERALEGLLKPEERETITGHAEVRRIFKISRFGNIAGCFVTDGTVARNHRVRLVRDGVVIHEGRMASLRREKDDAREVREGFECGILIDSFTDVKAGDVIEAFQIEKIARTLDSVASPAPAPTN